MGVTGLIAFDLDGTLVHIWSAWSWIHRLLGTEKAAKPYADLYYAGKINYQKWAELDVELWYGVPIERIKQAIESDFNLIPGSTQLIAALRDKGFQTAIISSGLDVFAEQAKSTLNIDISRANRLQTDSEGRICGVEVNVAFDNKHNVLKEIAKSFKIPLSRCAAIGDSRNDIPMFKIAGFSIAFNPTNEDVAKNALEVIESQDALDLLPPLYRFFGIK